MISHQTGAILRTWSGHASLLMRLTKLPRKTQQMKSIVPVLRELKCEGAANARRTRANAIAIS